MSDENEISVLVPNVGWDEMREITVDSICRYSSPYKVYLCVENISDAAYMNCLRKADQYKNVEVVTGGSCLKNPKLKNLEPAWEKTKTKYVCMVDCNVQFEPNTLLNILLEAKQVDVLASPAMGVWAENWSGALECAFLNQYELYWQKLAAYLGRPFVQGKMITVRQEILPSLSLIDVDYDLAEDTALTKYCRSNGLRIGLLKKSVRQPIGNRKLAQVISRRARWMTLRRLSFPLYYALEPLSNTLFLAGLAGMLVDWQFGFRVAIVRYVWEQLYSLVKCYPYDLGVSVFRDAIMLPLWLYAYTQNSVVWNGNVLRK